MTLFITGLYASLTALLIIALAYRVVKFRRLNAVGIGNGDNKDLALAVRVHGNLVENAPIVLILLAVAETHNMPEYLLHCFGSLWVFARLIHAIGLTQGKGGYHWGRFWGVLLTWIILLSLAVSNIGFFLGF
ncbi:MULTISPECIES: MAPEG family protein [Shewanella]|jgi:uncharacterized membrane protein YecN with MAPEG domain|uniref:MAPEG family protein n=1 Tax=Shewanella holmiensis TaxID=2952222 RepID=A0A9X3AUG5_9GAMM|nr:MULTISPECIES: MAPEG family protein [Shewanella]MCT7941224.1 MAPEG family protein [Shewanella holmiensis]MDP5147384.1 MAPEG family protein [Shewanella sp. ULN5]